MSDSSSPPPATSTGPAADTAPDTSSENDATALRVRQIFRGFAIAEAISWGLLLVAMFFKWVVADDPHAGPEGGVPIAGPIHGVMFVGYCLAALAAWRTFSWRFSTLVWALLAAIPPFFTVWFEIRADRRGLLGRPASATAETGDAVAPTDR